MLKEFKEFIMRGNVMDLAVAVVVGGAFTAIVTALVDHILMPIVAAVTGNSSVEEIGVNVGPAELGVGAFLQAVIDFVLIAFVLFLMIKVITTIGDRLKREEEVPAEVEVPTAESYLEEIRDLLIEQKENNKTTPTEDTTHRH